jgi:tetratricopeptide (TPR) repeat protein
MKTISCIILALGLVVVATPALAQKCPINSFEVSKEKVGNKLILRCACVDGYVLWQNKSCVTIDQAVSGNPLPPELVADLFLGNGFAGDDLRKAAEQDRWPTWDKFLGFMTSILAETGAFELAEPVIEMVGPEAEKDPAVIAGRQRIAELRRKHAQLFTLMRPQAGRAMIDLAISHMPLKGQAFFIVGVSSFKVGQYDAALKYLKEARSIVPGDQGIDESLVIVRSVQQAELDRQDPVAARRRDARIFRAQGAAAAMMLGTQLVSAGDYQGAEIVLREAHEKIRRLPGQNDFALMVNDGLAKRVSADRQSGDKSMVSPPGKRDFDKFSKVDLMLMALEYGQKDWSRSLFFLETALRSDRTNINLNAAYYELKKIAASAP